MYSKEDVFKAIEILEILKTSGKLEVNEEIKEVKIIEEKVEVVEEREEKKELFDSLKNAGEVVEDSQWNNVVEARRNNPERRNYNYATNEDCENFEKILKRLEENGGME